MDVVSDWVSITGASGTLLARTRVQGAWGMAMPRSTQAMFHLMLEGACWLRLKGHRDTWLGQGDLVLLPHGQAHDLVDQPKGKAIPLDVLLKGPPPKPFRGPGTTVACGAYRFDGTMTHPLLQGLPNIVHLPRAALAADASLSSTLGLLTQELERTEPGSEWLLSHLFDVLLVYLFRSWSKNAADQTPGWLAALRDPALSRVLTRIHAQPDAPWTVESLAREAHLSRAAFARRFSAGVGQAPLAYLTRWRMGVAARLLRETRSPLAEIAARVGYESEFAFSRAFKRAQGQPPTAFRHAA